MSTEALPKDGLSPDSLEPATAVPFGSEFSVLTEADPDLGQLTCAAAGVGVADTIDRTTRPTDTYGKIFAELPSDDAVNLN